MYNLDGQKRQCCPAQAQAWAFKIENNSGCQQLFWGLKAEQ
jgi:hypothetical protein